MHRAVFVDRDGTLIEEKEYLSRPEQVAILPGVPKALARLQRAGYKLFIVTNQAGIGRGYFTEADMHAVHQHLVAELSKDGVVFEKIYFAPEAPNQPPVGRKPSPKFLFEARDHFSLDLQASYIVGDKLLDLECGWNAGLKKSLLVRTGYGAQWERNSPDKLAEAIVVDDMPAAVDWILQASQAPREMARLGIRRQNPDASPEQIEELLHRLEFARTVTEQDLLLDCVARLIAGSMARDA